MNKLEHFFLGFVAGAGLMYLLDPDRGRRRRALIRDQVVHGAHELGEIREEAASRARDLRNRARGVAAEVRTRIRSEDADDPVLEARVRAELGRLVSNPGAIHVDAEEGRVTLSGTVLSTELDRLLSGVEGVPGVRDVVNQISAREETGDTPDLQGAGR